MKVEKENKKIIIGICVLGIILLINSRKPFWANNNQSSKTIYEQGLDIISQMNELATSEIFLDMLNTPSDCKEVISEAFSECDYGEPESVYKVIISNDKMLDYLAENSQIYMFMLSDKVKEVLFQGSVSNWGLQLNEKAEYLAASTILRINKTFVNNELQETVAYIYIYKSAIPVIVTFIPGEDNAVEAVGNYIFNEKIMNDDQGYIESYFGAISTKIDKIY